MCHMSIIPAAAVEEGLLGLRAGDFQKATVKRRRHKTSNNKGDLRLCISVSAFHRSTVSTNSGVGTVSSVTFSDVQVACHILLLCSFRVVVLPCVPKKLRSRAFLCFLIFFAWLCETWMTACGKNQKLGSLRGPAESRLLLLRCPPRRRGECTRCCSGRPICMCSLVIIPACQVSARRVLPLSCTKAISQCSIKM